MTLPEPQHTSTSLTVLIVDDEEEELRYWADLVRNLGKNYTVLTALDRQSAHAICREHRVDCVLLDLDMPGSVSISYWNWFLIQNSRQSP